MAAAEGHGKDADAAEVSALEDEANMPLEQLMAMYGYVTGGDDKDTPAGDGQADDADQSPSGNAKEESVPADSKPGGTTGNSS